MEFLIGLLVGGVVGAAVGYVLSRRGSRGDGGELAQEMAAVRATHEATVSQLTQLQATQAGTQSELATAQQAQVKAETQRDETAKSLAEQKTQFEQVRKQFTDTFKSLSGEALKSNTEQFLLLANKAFEATIAEAKGDIGKKQQAVDALVKPMAETLKRYEKQVAELEKTRQSAYVSLNEQVKALTVSQVDLKKETGNLVTALRRPQVRGRWGELTLRRVVELAGMSEHCDFS
jgi:DNA recombination protein RmuC